MRPKKFHKVIANTDPAVREHIKFSMDILDRINELLEQKFQGKQKLLADKLNKTEAEISKWFSGTQNFTTKTLIKLQVAFGEPILAVVSSEYSNSTYELVKVPYNKTRKYIEIDKTGKLNEEIEFKKVKFSRVNKISKEDLPA